MLLCFPLLGFNVFEKTAAAVKGVREFFLKSKGIEARGFESSQGFVVRAGSRAVKNEVASIQNFMTDMRGHVGRKRRARSRRERLPTGTRLCLCLPVDRRRRVAGSQLKWSR